MTSDAWGEDTLQAGSPLGAGLLRSAGGVLNALFPRPDPLQELRVRLAALELQRALKGVVSWRDVGDLRAAFEPVRQDVIFAGRRGTGKTAAAVLMAQELGTALKVPAYALGWRPEVARRVNLEAVDADLNELQDCVCVVDEAGLRVRPGKRDEYLAEAIALGRQNGVSLLWSTQSGAGVHRDVLRQDVRMVWGEVDPIQARFDREELADLVSGVVGIQAGGWERGRWLTYIRGQWVGGRLPLPVGWSDEVSTLWRRRR